MTLTKAGITERVQSKIGYGKAQSAKVVSSLFEIIKKALESGDDVSIAGFGRFSVLEKKGRRFKNRKTEE